MKKCPVCNKPLPRRKNSGLPRIYCSKKCKSIANWRRHSERNRKKYFCRACGDELAYKYQAGQQSLYCDDVCRKIGLGWRMGHTNILFGSVVLNNNCMENDHLYAMTLREMSEELGTPIENLRIETIKALFKFKVIYEELYGKPEFSEPQNDCWDQLYNYIVSEDDHMECAT